MQKMGLFAAPVQLSHPPITDDLPRQRLPATVLAHLQKNRPVGPFQESPLRRAAGYAGLHNIEYDHAAGAQGGVYTKKEGCQPGLAAPPVERIVDALADRSNGIARRQFGAQKR